MRRSASTIWTSPFGGLGRDKRRLPHAERILVPVTGSTIDRDALLLAGEVARSTKGTLFVVYIVEVPRAMPLDEPPEEEIERAESILGELEELCERHRFKVAVELLQARQTGPTVVNEAIERQADLIIMGIGNQRQYGEFAIDESIPYILQHAPPAVWFLREPLSSQNGM